MSIISHVYVAYYSQVGNICADILNEKYSDIDLYICYVLYECTDTYLGS